MIEAATLPTIIAGPILRRVDATSVTVWLVTSAPCSLNLITDRNSAFNTNVEGLTCQRTVQMGSSAFTHLLTFTSSNGWVAGEPYYYEVIEKSAPQEPLLKFLSGLTYGDIACHFIWQPELSYVCHGSCRKPHYEGTDALLALDAELASHLMNCDTPRPDCLFLTGDQVYVDDVAGPMVQAIHQTIERLGLIHETFEGATETDSQALLHRQDLLYHREKILPHCEGNASLFQAVFGAKRKPVFTSVNAKNHLISLSEVFAMYLLVWSPECWSWIRFNSDQLDPQRQDIFEQEKDTVEAFTNGLENVRRLLAHIPCFMIFDDHDVTDDWNLTRGWEETVYGHPLSNRMVGNAVIAYWLCQGWGNTPDRFDDLHNIAKNLYSNPGDTHETLIEAILEWDEWDYQLGTNPPVSVLDTRTQRWRSESNPNKPSGLLDWEGLCGFQQTVMGHDRVIVISAAPMFGVKFIEAIQRVFTFLGHALTVDAENWMAHKGTAQVLLNIFHHKKTPPQFIILSGDVHYSFTYDIELKRQKRSPHIIQFTCSGIKNAFPDGLLRKLDLLNRLFYGPRSPLNWFTKRKNMRVTTRHPYSDDARTLVNQAAIGQLFIASDSNEVTCQLLLNDGSHITFLDRD